MRTTLDIDRELLDSPALALHDEPREVHDAYDD